MYILVKSNHNYETNSDYFLNQKMYQERNKSSVVITEKSRNFIYRNSSISRFFLRRTSGSFHRGKLTKIYFEKDMNICLKVRILRSTMRKIKFHLPKLTFHFMKRLYLYLYTSTNFNTRYINHTSKRILLEKSRIQNEETTKNFYFILKIYPKLHSIIPPLLSLDPINTNYFVLSKKNIYRNSTLL